MTAAPAAFDPGRRLRPIARAMPLVALAATTLAPAAALASSAAAAVEPPTLRYEVQAVRGGAELRVVAQLPATGSGRLVVGDGFAGFVSDVRLNDGGGARPAVFTGEFLEAPACAATACRVEYVFHLEEAARGRRRRGGAIAHEGAWLAPPSVWLVRPVSAPADARFRLSVRTTDGVRFVSGLLRSGEGRQAEYAGELSVLDDAPYSGFGRFEVRPLRIGGSEVDLAIAPGGRALSSGSIEEWVRRSARGVADYLGGLPVPRVLVIVLPGAGRRPVGYGSTMGNGGASIMISVSAGCTPADLRSDWVLVHELVHLALPNLPRRHHWVEEGLSTYVEPVIRTRLGLLTPAERWAELMRGLPKGQPRPDDRGLDLTPSWGSTYWGGAAFWFLADLEIRERSGNRLGLEDALRGIIAAGGSIMVSWDLDRVLRAGDAATGLDVLETLHARMGGAPWGVDLDALWRRLGVVSTGQSVRLERDAPLAALRDAMLSPAATSPRRGDSDR